MLLEEWDAERAPKDRLESRVQVHDRLVASTTADVGVDGVALDRAGTNDRHLDHDVVERARLDARQRRHLRARLHLEDADGVGLAQEVVDRVLLGQRPEVDRDVVEGLHLLDAAVQRVEHAEAQQVELHETDRRAVVLVPLQDRAPGHATPLDRADLDHRSIAQHHPGRMDAQVSRTIEHLARHGRDELGHVGTRGHGVAIDAVT